MSESGHGIGIPGVEIHSQDHICALFNGDAQRDEILLSFLHAGLADGDKCVVILDHAEPLDVLEQLGSPKTLDAWQRSGALDVSGRPEAPTAGEELTVERMLAMWDDAVAATEDASPFDFVRVTGDATWWTQQTDDDTLVRYESELTDFIPERLGVLCLYDVARMSGTVLVDTVRAHPRLLVGSVVIENPFYLPPEELEAVRRDPGSATSPTDYDIFQLANLPRLDLSRPVVEVDCSDCGATLFAAAPTTRDATRSDAKHATTHPSPPSFLACPHCGAFWTQGVDGTLTRRGDRAGE